VCSSVARADVDESFGSFFLGNTEKLDPKVLKALGQAPEGPDELPGDQVYFANPDAAAENWRREYAIVVGRDKYAAHGLWLNKDLLPLGSADIIRILDGKRKSGAATPATKDEKQRAAPFLGQ